jgi:cold shock CspA family protein
MNMNTAPRFATINSGVAEMSKRVGKVKFWLESSGYGFLYPPENDPSAADTFVHANELRKSGILTPLRPGQTLSYDLGTHNRNDRHMAVNLEVVE